MAGRKKSEDGSEKGSDERKRNEGWKNDEEAHGDRSASSELTAYILDF